jgi:nucleoid-associated protein YgaU
MSEATKSTALAHALQHHHGLASEDSEVIATAAKFAAFIEGAAEAPAKTAAPKTAAPAKAATPAPKPKKAAPEPEPEETEEEAETEGLTKEQVGESIQALIDADMIDEATAIFKKYKAPSLGKLDPKFYEKVKAEADALLLNS